MKVELVRIIDLARSGGRINGRRLVAGLGIAVSLLILCVLGCSAQQPRAKSLDERADRNRDVNKELKAEMVNSYVNSARAALERGHLLTARRLSKRALYHDAANPKAKKCHREAKEHLSTMGPWQKKMLRKREEQYRREAAEEEIADYKSDYVSLMQARQFEDAGDSLAELKCILQTLDPYMEVKEHESWLKNARKKVGKEGGGVA